MHKPKGEIKSPVNGRKKNKGQLRIIGGKWRGRKLTIADVDGLRPTADRVRETLFNWLMYDIPQSRCLDLFAGAGALGIESVSRGAQQALLIEQHPKAAATLAVHQQRLSCDALSVLQTDALTWLKAPTWSPGSVDVVFIDPPFAKTLWPQVVAALQASALLKEGAAIYIESPVSYCLQTPDDWQLEKEKHTAHVSYRLYRQRGASF